MTIVATTNTYTILTQRIVVSYTTRTAMIRYEKWLRHNGKPKGTSVDQHV